MSDEKLLQYIKLRYPTKLPIKISKYKSSKLIWEKDPHNVLCNEDDTVGTLNNFIVKVLNENNASNANNMICLFIYNANNEFTYLNNRVFICDLKKYFGKNQIPFIYFMEESVFG